MEKGKVMVPVDVRNSIIINLLSKKYENEPVSAELVLKIGEGSGEIS